MIRKKKCHLVAAIIVFGLVVNTELVLSQDIEADLKNGFTNAKPELIVKHFDSNVKIIIKPNSYSPSREESIKIISDFLKRNPVLEYQSKFDSGKRNSNFMIKILKTKEKSFRVTLFFKSSGEVLKINLLRIEPENESTL